MAGVNKVILIGNLGADPEVKTLPSGTTVANLRLATSVKWTDKEGKRVEKTEWHRLVAFGKSAEFIGEYLRKGQQVYVEGRLQTREWEKDGAKQYATEVIIEQITGLGSRKGGSEPDQPNGNAADNTDIPF